MCVSVSVCLCVCLCVMCESVCVCLCVYVHLFVYAYMYACLRTLDTAQYNKNIAWTKWPNKIGLVGNHFSLVILIACYLCTL